jgi:alanyl-tRNA synthetase
MPDVLEKLVIEQSHRVAAHVLNRLRRAGEPVHYADYVEAMERYGFDSDLAKETFFELGYEVDAEMNVKK